MVIQSVPLLVLTSLSFKLNIRLSDESFLITFRGLLLRSMLKYNSLSYSVSFSMNTQCHDSFPHRINIDKSYSM
jgi:hypothetical protein